MQADPPPPAQPGPINISIDLSGLANLIWQSFIDHIGDVGTAVWTGIRDHMGEIGNAILVPLEDALHHAAAAIWDAAWTSSANIVTQLPPDLTYNFGPYRAVASDPLPLAIGGATLALVLLGLRTLVGSMVGRDHVITHVTGRLIPAVFMCLAYPVLIAQGVGLINAAATALGQAAIGGGIADGLRNGLVLAMPTPLTTALLPAYILLWLVLIYYAVRLTIRLAYSLFRFLVALLFGPVAIMLWAIPQTEWVTWLWLRELLGWGTAPLLVTAALAMAIPLAGLHSGGFLAGVVFSIAGLMAAYDLVGLLGVSHGGGRGVSPLGYVRMAAGAAHGGGAGVAAIPANQVTTRAEMYGYQ